MFKSHPIHFSMEGGIRGRGRARVLQGTGTLASRGGSSNSLRPLTPSPEGIEEEPAGGVRQR